MGKIRKKSAQPRRAAKAAKKAAKPRAKRAAKSKPTKRAAPKPASNPVMPSRGGGWNRKSLGEHLAEGTYRRDRHGPLGDAVLDYCPKPAGKVLAGRASQARWIKNESDERAFRTRFRFNEGLAAHAAEFFPKYLRLSVGEWYGKPFELTDFQRDEIIYPLFGWVDTRGHRRYQETYIELPKKNYKSTTASGIGLYMLTADDEPGAVVWSLGADKDQAGVVHREAIHMVEASPALDAILKINRTTDSITYPARQAYYHAVSAAPRGKHGPSIHCAIADELHEWYGAELWESIKYAHRARANPLRLVITNAGKDPQSVCYRQRKKAEAVLAGTIEDHRFFALIKAATREEAEGEIEAVRDGATEIPVAARCNPGLGHVIQKETLLRDIHDAIEDPAEMRNLLRLTYSVWVVGNNPFLNADAWSSCAREFSENDLLGRPCAAAIDASQTDDLCALALVFPGDEENEEERTYRLLVYHWTPSEMVERRAHLVDFAAWGKQGWITIVPKERVLPMAWVKQRILEVAEKFQLVHLFYDPMYFETTAEELRQTHGVECVKFPQNIMAFAGPTRQFRLLVNSERLHHNGNPLLTWQIGHCETKTDVNNNERPVKPKTHDVRKIDGVVAAIMALDGVYRMPAAGSAYDDHEMMYANEV